MIKHKHTPGPWKASVGACYDQVEVEDGPLICFASVREDSKANVRLIAAAPELLESVDALLGCMSLAGWEGDPIAVKARADIAKATGEQANSHRAGVPHAEDQLTKHARERLAAVYRTRGYSDRLALVPGTCRMSEAAVSVIADALRAAAGAEVVVAVDESIKPVAWVEKTPKGYTRMWSHSLEAWTHRPADPEPLFDKAAIERLTSSRDFYRLRCERLQAVQAQMRDPERKAVCDILANGETYQYREEESR